MYFNKKKEAIFSGQKPSVLRRWHCLYFSVFMSGLREGSSSPTFITACSGYEIVLCMKFVEKLILLCL